MINFKDNLSTLINNYMIGVKSQSYRYHHHNYGWIPLHEIHHLSRLRTLVSENPIIVKSGFNLSDSFLLGFLRGKKYHLQEAFQTVQKYVGYRHNTYAKFFSEVTPASLQYLLAPSVPRCFGLLNYIDSDGCRILVIRTIDIRHFRKVDHLTGLLALGLDECLYDEKATMNGLKIIVSGEGFSLRHAKEFTPYRMKMAMDLFFDASPFQIKGVHLVNCSTSFQWVFSISKRFLSAKLLNKVVVHEKLEELRKYVPSTALPDWIGGRGSTSEENIFDLSHEAKLFGKQVFQDRISRKFEGSY